MISKIKDLIYDFNDILVALLILAVAAGVITWRVADIMAYPEFLASQTTFVTADKNYENIDMDDVDLAIDDTVNADLNTNPDDANSDILGTETTEPEPAAPVVTGETKITIPSGTPASKIAQILFDAGLITSTDDFIKELVAEKADTKLKAGTFTIPAGSNLQDIIAILVK